MRQISTFLLLFLCFMVNLDAQNSNEDYLLGTFTQAESQLTITVSRRPDQVYEGSIFFQGQQYPYEGFRLLGMLSGEYQYNGYGVGFSLSRVDGVYYFNSEGQSLEMKRISVDPSKAPPGSSTSTSVTTSAKAPANSSVGAATGTLMKDPYGTYTFKLPEGWYGQESSGMIVASKSGDEVQMTATAHNYNSVAELKAAVEPVVQDQSKDLYLTSKVQDFGSNGVIVTYEGAVEGKPIQIEIVSLISPYGGGVSFVGSGITNPPAFTQSHVNYLRSMAKSAQFTKAPVGAEASKWSTMIGGKQLTYLSTGNGGSERIDLHLCSGGSFVRKYEGSYSSGGYADFSSASADTEQGTWKIVSRGSQSVLLLSYSRGSSQEYAIASRSASNEVSLNGNRYFIQGTANCR